ncbi:MAG TPA: hypothetical protein VEI52_19605, partial [Terriglobales bacterium]|nr:hypothetical protein [Terriglobales bacterium]
MGKSRGVSLSTSPSVVRNLLILAIICFGITSVANAQTWTLAWGDEFDGTKIDTTKWTFDYGDLNVNNELEYYCGPVGDPNNQSPCNS